MHQSFRQSFPLKNRELSNSFAGNWKAAKRAQSSCRTKRGRRSTKKGTKGWVVVEVALKTKMKTWQQQKQIHAICIFATRRDATLCAPNDTFNVAARRIVCQHWQDEARRGGRREARQTKLNQKPQSQKKRRGGSKWSRQQSLLCICKKCRLKRPPTTCLCFIKYFPLQALPLSLPPLLSFCSLILFLFFKYFRLCVCVGFFWLLLPSSSPKVNIQKTK